MKSSKSLSYIALAFVVFMVYEAALVILRII
jgi:hypothetical protein